jgi:hypothetical protein
MSEKQDAYVTKMKNKLHRWSAEIDKMNASGLDVGFSARKDFEEQIANLQVQRKDISKKIEAVHQAAEATWKNLRTEVDSSWKILDKAVHTAMDTFKESGLPGNA